MRNGASPMRMRRFRIPHRSRSVQAAEQPHDQNDRQWNSNQPEQQSASHTTLLTTKPLVMKTPAVELGSAAKVVEKQTLNGKAGLRGLGLIAPRQRPLNASNKNRDQAKRGVRSPARVKRQV